VVDFHIQMMLSCSLKFQVLQWELEPIYSCSHSFSFFFFFLFFFLVGGWVPFWKDSFKHSLLLTIACYPLLWLKWFILIPHPKRNKWEYRPHQNFDNLSFSYWESQHKEQYRFSGSCSEMKAPSMAQLFSAYGFK